MHYENESSGQWKQVYGAPKCSVQPGGSGGGAMANSGADILKSRRSRGLDIFVVYVTK
jgi:hypothetical protein